VSPPPPDAAPTATSATSAARPPLALHETSHRAETEAHLQRRLAVLYAVVVGIAGAIFVTIRALGWFGFDVHPLGHPANLVHLAAIAVGSLCWFAVRRGPLATRELAILNAWGGLFPVAVTLAIYALLWNDGKQGLVPVLILFTVGRAVFVPCTAFNAAAVAASAPLGVLALRLALGPFRAWEGQLHPEQAQTFILVLDQVFLWLGVGLAALAAHVIHGLRLRVRRAESVGQYRIEAEIGQGSMGVVYRARHALLRRPTAIKVLDPAITGPETLERFEREVRETSRLTHPNTIRVFDYGHTADGLFFYAMELLDGADLAQVVARTGRMPAARVIHVLSQACAALREAHGLGLVHRDVKPGNIMLCRHGGEHDFVKVVDFGLVKDVSPGAARLTQVGLISGTPETLAPEVIQGAPASPAADLYGLGCVAYFLLTGRPIFDVAAPLEFLVKHQDEAPVPPSRHAADVPRDLETVVLRCLEKDPARRHPGAGALRGALQRCRDARMWTETRARAWWTDEFPEQAGGQA